MNKPLCNVQFLASLWNASRKHGHDALSLVCALATANDSSACVQVGAIMHGATWRACPSCGGSGKRGRGKCVVCQRSGEHPEFRSTDIDKIRATALADLGW